MKLPLDPKRNLCRSTGPAFRVFHSEVSIGSAGMSAVATSAFSPLTLPCRGQSRTRSANPYQSTGSVSTAAPDRFPCGHLDKRSTILAHRRCSARWRTAGSSIAVSRAAERLGLPPPQTIGSISSAMRAPSALVNFVVAPESELVSLRQDSSRLENLDFHLPSDLSPPV